METPQANPSRWRGLSTRVASAIQIFVLTVFCMWQGGFLFQALVLLTAVFMLKEWDALTKNEGVEFKLGGYLLTIVPCACLLWLRSLSTQADGALGVKLVFALILIIAATDIGAYFSGKKFGRLKLAPTISPGKTWEGLAGGVLFSIFIAAIALPSMSLLVRLATGLLLALLAQAGDILESWVKRRAGVKDSGNLIPGHGGLLDRLDGYLLAAPAFALLVYLYVV